MTYISLILCFFIQQEKALVGVSVPHWALALVLKSRHLKEVASLLTDGSKTKVNQWRALKLIQSQVFL